VIVWNNGGGTQSTAILALIVQGELPVPDVAIISDTGREKSATWRYIDRVHRPALAALGLELTVARAEDLARYGLELEKGRRVLIPSYGTLNGRVGKGRAFCSGLWKREVIVKKLRSMGHKKYEQWLGISIDEADRAVPAKPRAWAQTRYPLISLGMSRDDCQSLIYKMGWPAAPKSSCYMCPNIGTNEWRRMQKDDPADFEKAVAMDAEMIAKHGLYLHRSLVPLSHLDLQAQLPLWGDDEVSCSTSGGCWT